MEDRPAMPGYEQNQWVAIHDYQGREWVELIEIWRALIANCRPPPKPFPMKHGRGQ